MTSYAEKLKDPRWQKKRTEILNRDGFRCKNCGCETSTLHVHHGYYEWGKDPWEYPSISLHTYCEQCHEEIGDVLKLIKKRLGEISELADIEAVCSVVDALALRQFVLNEDRKACQHAR